MAYAKILVGTDGSETALRAIETAAAIAKSSGADLEIASVYEQLAPDELAKLEDAAPGANRWQVTAGAQADELIVSARELAARAGVESTGHAVPGEKPGEALIHTAEELGCDLIVTGNVGMTGAKRFLLGSVPDFIAHHATCDVLIEHTRE